MWHCPLPQGSSQFMHAFDTSALNLTALTTPVPQRPTGRRQLEEIGRGAHATTTIPFHSYGRGQPWLHEPHPLSPSGCRLRVELTVNCRVGCAAVLLLLPSQPPSLANAERLPGRYSASRGKWSWIVSVLLLLPSPHPSPR